MKREASEAGGGKAYEAALVNHAPAHRSSKVMLALGALLLALFAAVQFLPPDFARWVVPAAAIALASAGVLSLLAHAIGIVGFRSGATGDPFSRAIVDGEARGILVTDQDGRVLYANRAYADLTGALQARDVRPIERVFARAGEAEGEIYRLNQAASGGRAAQCEVEAANHPGLAGADQRDARYRISCRPLTLMPDDPTIGRELSRGRLTAWEIEDISERSRQRTLEFKELRDAFEALDAAPAGFVTIDAAGRIAFMNAVLARRLGIDLTETVSGTVEWSDILMTPASSRRTRDDGTRVMQLELKGPGGEALPVEFRSVEAEDATGQTVTHGIVLDAAPEEGGRSANRAARMFEASPMAIASLDEDGAILQSNAAFARAFGSPEGLPAHLHDIAAADEREALDEAFEKAREGAAALPLEIVTRGEEIIRIHMTSPGDQSGETREAVLLYALEVTEQRALERQMADTQKNQAIGVIAGGVAHDFNNVLTAIVGFSDLLLAKYRPSDRSFHDVTQIRNTAFKGASLVRQLLAYTRRQTLRPKTLAMPDVLTDLSMILRRLAGERIRVEIKHGRDVWPVRADLGALERVFVNLCVNARDAINDRVEDDQEPGRKPREGVIRIATRNVAAAEVSSVVGPGKAPAEDQLLIEVSDTGTGMSKDVMAKVFDPFFTTKKAGKGTGLGLSSVVGIVEQSGGTIHLDSELGEGTSFRILLPRHVPSAEELQQPEVAPKEQPRDLAGSATILFVEDEDSVRAFGTRTLKERGYTVHEAENGEDALEIVEELEGQIDLIVSDVVMPEMDGPTLFRSLRETAPDIPFIFASGYAEEAFEKSLPDAADAKFGFIPKPYTLKDLAIIVKDTLDERANAAERSDAA